MQDILTQLPPHHFWFAVMAGSVAAGTGFFLIFRWLNHLRLVEDMPTATIQSAPQGYVELQGQARMMEGEPVRAPLSGEDCVWYRYTVEHKSDNDDGWSTLEKGVSDAIFHLQDATRVCVVDPEGASVIPSVTLCWRGHRRHPGFAPAHSGWLERWLDSGPFRYTESRIHDGDPLYALGQFVALRELDPATPRDEVRDLLCRWKRDPQELRRRFDTDGDHEISLREWEAAREQAEREVMASWHERSEISELPLLKKPNGGRPYLLSTLPQKDLAARLRRRILLASLLFLGLGSWVIWALNVRTGE